MSNNVKGMKGITSANIGIMQRFVSSILHYNYTSMIKNKFELYVMCSGMTSGQDAMVVDLLSAHTASKSIKNITMHAYASNLTMRHVPTIEAFVSALEEIRIKKAAFLETLASNTTINGHKRKTQSLNMMYTLKMNYQDKLTMPSHFENK